MLSALLIGGPVLLVAYMVDTRKRIKYLEDIVEWLEQELEDAK